MKRNNAPIAELVKATVSLLTPNFNVMKKVISLIKRGAKAYFRQAAKTYAWTPTGTIPVGI